MRGGKQGIRDFSLLKFSWTYFFIGLGRPLCSRRCHSAQIHRPRGRLRVTELVAMAPSSSNMTRAL
jgi:hypothetical protein